MHNNVDSNRHLCSRSFCIDCVISRLNRWKWNRCTIPLRYLKNFYNLWLGKGEGKNVLPQAVLQVSWEWHEIFTLIWKISYKTSSTSVPVYMFIYIKSEHFLVFDARCFVCFILKLKERRRDAASGGYQWITRSCLESDCSVIVRSQLDMFSLFSIFLCNFFGRVRCVTCCHLIVSVLRPFPKSDDENFPKIPFYC